MQLIKLNATTSTNEALKNLWQDGEAEDWTVVWTDHQYMGRGQQGTVWQSEQGKNLTFSVLKNFDSLKIQQQFLLNMGVSLAIYQALTDLKIPGLSVKWPNDIMSASSKICGILIENIVKAGALRTSIIGVGLNVNQVVFEGLPHASSLRNITAEEYDLSRLLQLIMNQMRHYLNGLNKDLFADYKKAYEEAMFRRGLTSSFEFQDGSRSSGILRGVSTEGKLEVELEEGISLFQSKEIRLLN